MWGGEARRDRLAGLQSIDILERERLIARQSMDITLEGRVSEYSSRLKIAYSGSSFMSPSASKPTTLTVLPLSDERPRPSSFASLVAGATGGEPFSFSSSSFCFFRARAIILHDKFSIRWACGRLAFVLAYILHTWVARGSVLANSSGSIAEYLSCCRSGEPERRGGVNRLFEGSVPWVDANRSSENKSDKRPDLASTEDLGDTGEWTEDRLEEGS